MSSNESNELAKDSLFSFVNAMNSLSKDNLKYPLNKEKQKIHEIASIMTENKWSENEKNSMAFDILLIKPYYLCLFLQTTHPKFFNDFKPFLMSAFTNHSTLTTSNREMDILLDPKKFMTSKDEDFFLSCIKEDIKSFAFNDAALCIHWAKSNNINIEKNPSNLSPLETKIVMGFISHKWIDAYGEKDFNFLNKFPANYLLPILLSPENIPAFKKILEDGIEEKRFMFYKDFDDNYNKIISEFDALATKKTLQSSVNEQNSKKSSLSAKRKKI